jgi:4-diphosphocytidyl-2-C-methyl-D-erythritol kinase
MTIFTEFAAAKVNLTLEVLGKRPDGYHEITSLVAFADVGDRITLDTSRPPWVSTSGPFAAGIAGENLINVTLQRLAAASPDLMLGAIHLEKNLPVAAGIGGGSADAAAVIRAVRRANPEKAASIDWAAVALRIGADVPVCLESRLTWMTGLGEKVKPVEPRFSAGLSAVIVNPLVAVPADKTAQVFKMLQAGPFSSEAGVRTVPSAPQTAHDLLRLIYSGRNDLQRAAVLTVPAISRVIAELGSAPGSRFARLSGAGPTCFALFDAEADPRRVAEVLAAAHPEWWVKFVVLS